MANIIGILFGGPLIIVLIQRLTKALRSLEEARQRIGELEGKLATEKDTQKRAESRLSNILGLFENNADDIWTRKPIVKPERYSKLRRSIPIMVVANLKGGVGKTTLATNLAAYFEHKHGEKILAIDLDYQGSMSSMLLDQSETRNKREAKGVRRLISGATSPNQLIVDSFPIRDTKNDSRILECDSSFANIEMKVLFDWILEKDATDCRYRISDVLLSEEIQTRFQRIIIDAPPRITAGFLGSMCAGTHLIIPTILDVLSAERVGLFLADIRRWQDAGVLGQFENNLFVVGTMKRYANGMRELGSEKAAIDEIKRQLRDKLGSEHYFLEGKFIPRKEDVAEVAGLRIAYFDDPSVFDPVCDALYEKTKRDMGNYYENGTAERSFETVL